MSNAEIRIEQFVLAAALRLCVFIRIGCQWFEPRLVRRLKLIGERIKERNAA